MTENPCILDVELATELEAGALVVVVVATVDEDDRLDVAVMDWNGLPGAVIPLWLTNVLIVLLGLADGGVPPVATRIPRLTQGWPLAPGTQVPTFLRR